MQSAERRVFAVDESPLDVSGQQAVFPRQVFQVLLERFVLEFHGLHDSQVFEQVRFVVVVDRERRLLHQIRYVRLVELFQRFRTIQHHVRRGRLRDGRRFFGAAENSVPCLITIINSHHDSDNYRGEKTSFQILTCCRPVSKRSSPRPPCCSPETAVRRTFRKKMARASC